MAEYFETYGYRVYAGMREKYIKEFTANWIKYNKDIHPIKLDITNDANCKNVINQIIKKEGHIDVLVNNAGYTIVGPAINSTSKEFLNILDTNTVGAFRLIKNILPHMISKKSGKIINITSLNGLLALPNFALYCASKFALEAFSLSLHYETAKHKVWITNLAPGAIESLVAKGINTMPHKPAREKFLILKLLMPFLTYKQITDKLKWIIEHKSPPAEVILGSDAVITTSLKRYLPNWVWEKLLLYIWSR